VNTVGVAWSTVDRRWRGHGDAGAWWHAHRSKASGRYGARELADGGEKERGEHRGPILSLTGARVVVWWPGDGDEVVVEEELGGGSAQAWREGEKRGDGCGENRWGGRLL
jgi:hypothetical protein